MNQGNQKLINSGCSIIKYIVLKNCSMCMILNEREREKEKERESTINKLREEHT